MQGNIDFSGTLSGSIAGSGGGSTVTITPTLETGTKIADYTIDSNSGSLYAPTPEGLSAELPLSISENVISIDLSDYVTDSELSTALSNYDTTSEVASTYATKSEVTAVDLSLTNYIDTNYQPLLVAGANISINPITHEISASSGSWNYSTNEVDTGQKWINGNTVYCKVINLTPEVYISTNQWYILSNVFQSDATIIDCVVKLGNTMYSCIGASCYQGELQILNTRNSNIGVDTIILKYAYN